jgi:hypothetical protein
MKFVKESCARCSRWQLKFFCVLRNIDIKERAVLCKKNIFYIMKIICKTFLLFSDLRDQQNKLCHRRERNSSGKQKRCATYISMFGPAVQGRLIITVIVIWTDCRSYHNYWKHFDKYECITYKLAEFN